MTVKKVIFGIIALVIIGVLLGLFIDRHEKKESPTHEETGVTEITEGAVVEDKDEKGINMMENVFGNTYEADVTDNMSQVYVLGKNGFCLIITNPDTEYSEMRCEYKISDDLKEISIHYPDDTNITFSFDVKRNGKSIIIEGIEYKRTDRIIGE